MATSLRAAKIMTLGAKNRKWGALRPEICDLWPIFQLFRLTEPQKRYTRAIRTEQEMSCF